LIHPHAIIALISTAASRRTTGGFANLLVSTIGNRPGSVARQPADKSEAMPKLGKNTITNQTKAALALTLAVMTGYNLYFGPKASAAESVGSAISSAAELNPTPTELILVDGRKIQGQLVCEMDKHLVLYSPNLGTTASFEKQFVSSYTRNKVLVKLNEPRPLTPEESRYMNWTAWPDAAPEKGPAPYYAKEQWTKPKRLLVWAKPGESGDFSKTENWLAFGAAPTGSTWWDSDTDILLPSSTVRYKLVPGSHPELPEGRMTFTVRHITAERGSYIASEGCKVYGNEWVRLGGRVNMRFLNGWYGSKHTFTRVDALMVYQLGVRGTDVMWGLWAGTDKERVRPETEVDICQYLTVKKEDNASVEFLGVITARDKIQIIKGMAIGGPDCQVMSDSRNGDHVHPGATLAPPGEPEPACEGNPEVAKLRATVKELEAREAEAKRAYMQIKDDDEKIVQGMAAMANIRWELSTTSMPVAIEPAGEVVRRIEVK